MGIICCRMAACLALLAIALLFCEVKVVFWALG
jgi:hypothetical protein